MTSAVTTNLISTTLSAATGNAITTTVAATTTKTPTSGAVNTTELPNTVITVTAAATTKSPTSSATTTTAKATTVKVTTVKATTTKTPTTTKATTKPLTTSTRISTTLAPNIAVKFTSPVESSYFVGNICPVRWITTGITGTVDLLVVCGQTNSTVFSSKRNCISGAQNSLPITISSGFLLGGSCVVQLIFANVSYFSPYFRVADAEPIIPVVRVTAPEIGQVIWSGYIVPIKWTYSGYF